MPTKAYCKTCGFLEEYEETECGYGFYESTGKCYICSEDTYKEDGDPTKKYNWINAEIQEMERVK